VRFSLDVAFASGNLVTGRCVEVWHVEDIESLMRSLELEPPRAMLRPAARRSARCYWRQRAA
jgi:hypothetical protein